MGTYRYLLLILALVLAVPVGAEEQTRPVQCTSCDARHESLQALQAARAQSRPVAPAPAPEPQQTLAVPSDE
jgi:hypothetical protein